MAPLRRPHGLLVYKPISTCAPQSCSLASRSSDAINSSIGPEYRTFHRICWLHTVGNVPPTCKYRSSCWQGAIVCLLGETVGGTATQGHQYEMYVVYRCCVKLRDTSWRHRPLYQSPPTPHLPGLPADEHNTLHVWLHCPLLDYNLKLAACRATLILGNQSS
jgi:hypothetical protein